MSDGPDLDRTTKLPAEPTAPAAPGRSSSPSRAGGEGGAFAAGELIAERYEVIRFIARGAMGEVYEVEDRELQERVALKTILPDVAAEPQALERFRREIQLARQVTHPNVCRLFDLGHHLQRRESLPQRDVLFLTMELLVGETLRERLRRGKLTTAEALPLVEQMVAALAAAHEHEIVHRDLKSSNVLLVPSAKGGERVVVTDFGLARSVARGSASVTVSGELLGTPAYMAPEQVKGLEAGPAADVYALGVVLYEMVTGRLPFQAPTPMATALQRLAGPPASPRSLEPTLDRAWDGAILRCLELDPADRFVAITDVGRALAGERLKPGRRQRRRLLAAAAFAVVVVGALLGLLGPRLARQSSDTDVGAPAAPRAALAVLGFKHSGSPEAAWMATAVAEMLRTELGAGGRLRTIPGESVARVRMELQIADVDSLAADTLQRIHSILGADLVVLGTLLAQPSQPELRIRLDSRVQETRSGEVIVQIPETGGEAELFEIVSRLGHRLRQKLGIEPLSPELAAGVRAAMPASPEAARLYSEGLDRLRVLDALAARDLLRRAVEAEPAHPMIHAALAASWAALGYEATAGDEALLALEGSSDLPPQERQEVEGRYQELRGEWDEAVAVYRRLAASFPDDVEIVLRLAGAELAAGRPEASLATLDDLRRLPPPAGDDPRIDLAEAAAAKARTDFERQRIAAAHAAKRASAVGAHLLFAQARQQECDALVNLGRVKEGREACREARTIFTATGDAGGAARTENVLAVSYAREGELEEAAAGFRRALAEQRRIGNRRGVATQLNNLGNVLSFQGDLAGAKANYLEAEATFREIGARLDMALAANNVAAVLWDEGDLDGALAASRGAVPIFREAGATQHLARALYNVGEVLHARGDLAGARESYAEALSLYRTLGAPGDVADTLVGLAKVIRAEGDEGGALRLLEEARRLYVEAGDDEGAAAAAELTAAPEASAA